MRVHVQVIETLKNTLDDYSADLRQWLTLKTDVSYIVLRKHICCVNEWYAYKSLHVPIPTDVLRSVANAYLELLLVGTCVTQTVPGVSAGPTSAAGTSSSGVGMGSGLGGGGMGGGSGGVAPASGAGATHIVINSRTAERLAEDVKV